MSQPPPDRNVVSPVFRRLRADATQLEIARAHADISLYLVHDLPRIMAETKASIDESKAIVAVADSVSQRAANTASGLELAQHEIRSTQERLGRLLDRIEVVLMRVERLAHQEQLAEGTPPVEQLRNVVKGAIEGALEEAVEEVTGRHAPMTSDRVREVAKSITNEDKLAEAAEARKFRMGIIASVVGGIVMLIVAYFFGRMTSGH